MEVKKHQKRLILEGKFDRKNADYVMKQMKASKIPKDSMSWHEKVNLHNLRAKIQRDISHNENLKNIYDQMIQSMLPPPQDHLKSQIKQKIMRDSLIKFMN